MSDCQCISQNNIDFDDDFAVNHNTNIMVFDVTTAFRFAYFPLSSLIRAGVTGKREEVRLLRNLLREYEPAARPILNLTDVVEVRMGIALFQILELVSCGIAL